MRWAAAMAGLGCGADLKRWTRAVIGVIAALALQLTTALPAQADAFSEVIKVMRVIDQGAPGVLPFSADDLQQYHDLIVGCAAAGSTDDLLNCIEAAASTGAAQNAGVPSWLPQLIQVYFDIEQHDYWALVADAGEAAACAAAEIMTGVDVCGAIKALEDAAKEVASAAVAVTDAVAQFFSDFGADLASLGTDVYCFFAGCDDSPPPPTAIDTANAFCAPRGGLKSLLSHSGAVDDVDLICNDGTACQFKPGKPPNCTSPAQKAAVEAKKQAQNNLDFATQPQHWAAQFESKWIPQCLDDQCKFGVRFVKNGILATAQQRHAADPDYPWALMGLDLDKADKQAQQMVADSQARNAQAFVTSPQQWGAAFEARWLPKCPDDPCTMGIKLVRLGTILHVQQEHDANPSAPYSAYAGEFQGADAQAQQVIDDAENRVNASITAKAAAAWETLAVAYWSKQCADAQCVHEVSVLGQQFRQADIQLQAQEPDQSSAHVQGQVNQAYGPKFKAVVDASALRKAQQPPLRRVPVLTRPPAFQPRAAGSLGR